MSNPRIRQRDGNFEDSGIPHNPHLENSALQRFDWRLAYEGSQMKLFGGFLKEGIARCKLLISLQRLQIDWAYRHRAAGVHTRGRLNQNLGGRCILTRQQEADTHS